MSVYLNSLLYYFGNYYCYDFQEGYIMCFRPPNVQKPIKCPECGKFNPATNKVCNECKAELKPTQEPEQPSN